MKRIIGRILCFVGLHKWRRIDEKVYGSSYAHKRLVCVRGHCLKYLYVTR